LIELLVVLGVIALLLALITPAVQSAREAARRVDCQNRQRQVALAIHNFDQQHGHLPAPLNACPPPPAVPDILSVIAHVLPQLDQAQLYERIDSDPAENCAAVYPGPPRLTRPGNQELLQTRLSVVCCPSDNTPVGGSNLRVCLGVHPLVRSNHSAPEDGGRRGVFPVRMLLYPHRLREVTDGLSQTVMLSEKLVGDMDPDQYSPHRDSFYVARSIDFVIFESADEIMDACINRFTSPLIGEMSYGGATWLLAGKAFTGYNHVLTPNSRINDCTPTENLLSGAAVTARSWHPGGVNAALADGSVRFVSDSIDLRVWRALGTRAGGEVGVDF
jgi:prepilin-type processing-associated H-X9-DG protein